MKERLDYIDIAKAFAIFLVVLGHTVPSGSLAKTVIYSFHMPLFFILSGLFLKPFEKCSLSSFKNYAIRKFVALMIPFFIWGLFYMEFSFQNIAKLSYGSWQMLNDCHSLSSLWFLPVLFVSFMTVRGVDSFKLMFGKIRWVDCLIDILTMVILFAIGIIIPLNNSRGYPWGVNVACMASAFLIIGKYINLCASIMNRRKIVLVLLIVLLAIFAFTYNKSLPDIGYVRMADAHYGNLFFFILNSLLGSIILILFSIAVSWLPFKKNLFYLIGRNTLGIYLIHKPFVWLFRGGLIKLGFPVYTIWISLLIAVVALSVSLLISLVMNKYIPALFGKSIIYYGSEKI